jgi:hypothetical protein
MKTGSIGYTRNDGDFQLLITLNNNDDLMDDAVFNNLIKQNVSFLNDNLSLDSDEVIIVLDRQDSPDYLSEEEITLQDKQKGNTTTLQKLINKFFKLK